MSVYTASLYLHLLLYASLLGAEVVRGWAAHLGVSADRVSASPVLAAAAIANVSLILLLPVGFTLADTLEAYRVPDSAWQYVPWLLPALLLIVSLAADGLAHRPGVRLLLRPMDVGLRLVLGLGQVWDGTTVLFFRMTHMLEADWLAAKFAIYGLILLMTIPARSIEQRLRQSLASGAAGDEDRLLLGRLRAVAVCNVLLVLLVAWLGTAKPD